eukprot:5698161-Alexandrium_andersonii.AAC.1
MGGPVVGECTCAPLTSAVAGAPTRGWQGGLTASSQGASSQDGCGRERGGGHGRRQLAARVPLPPEHEGGRPAAGRGRPGGPASGC